MWEENALHQVTNMVMEEKTFVVVEMHVALTIVDGQPLLKIVCKVFHWLHGSTIEILDIIKHSDQQLVNILVRYCMNTYMYITSLYSERVWQT